MCGTCVVLLAVSVCDAMFAIYNPLLLQSLGSIFTVCHCVCLSVCALTLGQIETTFNSIVNFLCILGGIVCGVECVPV